MKGDKPKYDRTSARLAWWRKRLLGLALLTVPLPYVVYFVNPSLSCFSVTSGECLFYLRDVSPFMLPWAILQIVVYIVVCCETLHAARLSVASGILPIERKSMLINWWTRVSKSLRWHVLMAVARLGFVVAMAQVFYIGHIHYGEIVHPLLRPYYYIAFNEASLEIATNPQWETTLLGLFVMIGFAIANSALLVAIGQHIFLHRPFTSYLRLIAKRAGIAVFAIGIVFGFVTVDRLVSNLWLTIRDANQIYAPDSIQWNITQNYQDHTQILRPIYVDENEPLFVLTPKDIVEGSQLLFHALIDNGTLLAANIMRPFNDYSKFGHRYYYPSKILIKTNTEFVLKNLLVALVGMLFMGGWTSWHLWRIHRLGYNQGYSVFIHRSDP